MPWLAITQDDDARLQQVAPEYMRGAGKARLRVRWAVDTLCRMLKVEEARARQQGDKAQPATVAARRT